MGAPLEVSIDVACSPERAFAVWTSRIATWWPKDHTVSGRADLLVVFEPGVGGRIYERTAAGDEHEWGQVTRVGAADPSGLPLVPGPRRERGDRRGGPLRRHWPRRHPSGDRAPWLGAPRRERRGVARTEPTRLGVVAATFPSGNREGSALMAAGTKSDPWVLKTPPGTSEYTMFQDADADPPDARMPGGNDDAQVPRARHRGPSRLAAQPR